MFPEAPSIHMTSDGGLESAEQVRLMEPTLCSSTSLVTLDILTTGPSVNTVVSFHAQDNLVSCHFYNNKMELLQSQAPVDQELSGSLASARQGTSDIRD